MTMSTRLGLGALATIFTIGLTYASVELPSVVSLWLLDYLDTPRFDATYHEQETEAYIGSRHLRLIGITGLVATVALILAGFIAERRGLAAAGAVLFFLPVFGHFAASMFFLAGLAVLRVVWLPILDVSHDLLALGDVVYLPYAAVVWPLVNLGLDVRDQLPWLVTTLAVIGVAMIEELRMARSEGEVYEEFKRRTPFLMPLPSWLASVISAPMRLVLRRPWPENGRQVAAVVGFYAVILIAASVPFTIFDWPPRIGWWGFPYDVWPLAG